MHVTENVCRQIIRFLLQQHFLRAHSSLTGAWKKNPLLMAMSQPQTHLQVITQADEGNSTALLDVRHM